MILITGSAGYIGSHLCKFFKKKKLKKEELLSTKSSIEKIRKQSGWSPKVKIKSSIKSYFKYLK